MKTNYLAFFVATLIAFAAQAQTQTYDVYLSKGGSGTKTGATWENAADAETFLNGIAPPLYDKFTHNIYIKTGTYSFSAGYAMKLGNGIVLQGGFPTSATGTDKSGYNPIANPTVITFTSSSNYFLYAADGSYTVKGLKMNTANVKSLIDYYSSNINGPLNFVDDEIYNYNGNYSAMYIDNAFYSTTLNITNCYFHDNTDGISGSAITVTGSSGSNVVNIKKSSFSNNTCTKTYYDTNNSSGDIGGAITANNTTMNIDSSTFCGNKVPIGGGGAIGSAYNGAGGASRFTITNSTFSNNECMLGGGAIGMNCSSAQGGSTSFLKLTNTHFYGNKSGINHPNDFGADGGGAVEILSCNSTITNCNFYGNSSANTRTGQFGSNSGGAIGILGSTHTITNCKFEQNTAALRGGAIFFTNSGSFGKDLTINESTFKDNKYNGNATVSGSDLSIYDYPGGQGKIYVKSNSYMQLTGASDYKTYTGAASPNYNFDGTTIWGNTGIGISVTSATCPTSINPVVVNIQGSIWNDTNGNVTLDGGEAGTNAGGPLYVNLVSATNALITSVSVAADGSYTLTAPVNTSGLKLVLSTSPTATTPGSLPTGYVNTGEVAGSGNTATQSATLGQIELNTGATAMLTGQSFGIEQRPTTGSGTATVSNSGGTSPVIIPPSAFTSTSPSTDTAPGSVTAIRIISFPTNVTSLTINGVVYTASSPEFSGGTPAGVKVPTDGNGAPTVLILVDPTNDANPFSLSYVAVDNAGKEATNTGTATISSTLTTTVTGSVWNDADGSVTLNGSETGTNGDNPLYINLLDGTGTLVSSTSVASDGSYNLSGVPTNVTGYKLVLSISPIATTPGPLPTGYVNTGELVGAGNTATQSATLGQIELTTGTGIISGQNFGIEQRPTTGSGTATLSNSGGTNPVSIPPSAFTSISPSTDTAPGSVTAIRITSFPTNVTSLTINGVVYTASSPEFTGGTPTGVKVPTDGNGAPTVSILIDPTNDTNPVNFSFVAVDNAGQESITTSTVVINFTGVPDLTPIIYARPSSVYNTTPITVVVDVLELLGTPTSGTIVVKLTKDPLVSLVFPPTATSIGDKSVQNSVWSVNTVSDPNYYILTTSQVVLGGETLSFGFTGSLTPGATSGTLTLSSVIVGGSGGEVKFNNNTDADKIDYFQQ